MAKRYVVQLTKSQLEALTVAVRDSCNKSALDALEKAEVADEVLCLVGVESSVLYNMLIETMCGRSVLKMMFPRKPDREAACRVWKKLGGGSLVDAR